ncbi:sodium:solute symporter [Stieleria sp. TO1_6]|uniref:sodium:solute symporter n=1 Tax=Stieleria tagensis TaxID=2956795 RepID=UPI00209AB3DC|nr:sodium:solute symporter [Stieleria tagensis]MCO8122129.1 sodium:solute symporter [Stieleria tagensis]
MAVELGWIDGLVLVGLLGVAIAIGFITGRKNTTTESYLLGSRSLPWWAILGSIVATETSTATVLSLPGVGYGETGMRWLQIALGFVLGRTIVVMVFLPLYFDGKLMSAYQVLEKRLGSKVKSFASLLFLVTRNLGDGLRLYLAGAVLEAVFHWPFVQCVVVVGSVTILYTFFGGLRSVIWNDCIQFVIYVIGGIAAVAILIHLIPGGWSEIWSFAGRTDRSVLFNPEFSLSNPYNLWAGLIGGAVLTIGTHGTDHMMVQRYLSARSQQDAGRAVFLSSIVVVVQFALFLWIGVQLACFYSHYPLTDSIKPDKVFAHFIVDHFPKNVGLIGLMLAAILAAAMSTLSSSLSASVSALVNDFYVPLKRQPVSDRQLLRVSRWMTVGFGVLQIAVSIWANTLDESVINNALKIAGFSAGILLGLFALGIARRRASQTAVLIGAVAGIVVLVTVSFILKTPEGADRVAWPWLALIGSTTTFAVGSLAGFVFPRHARSSLNSP